MIIINDKIECCGCWACVNVCAHHSISMVEDNEGYRYPKINSHTCTNCGMCESVCPIPHSVPDTKNDNDETQKAFLAQHRDEEILQQSTSGGAFSAIAKWVIDKGGVVYGAAFNEQMEVTHRMVEKVEDLKLFRNSKYVQSLIGNTYKEAKKHLATGRYVCFSGTPCQLEGLLNYLRKPYERLIAVDVVCRAVPSPLVLRKYLAMQGKHLNFSNVRFRDKYHGYKYSCMSLTGKDKEYHEGIDTDYYLRSFFAGINLRPSCTDCKFRSPLRRTDFTIWDCFDIYKFNSKLDNDKGVTRILAHTLKAQNILKDISDELKLVEVEVDKAIEGVKEFRKSPTPHPQRTNFFADFRRMDTEECFKKYLPITMRHQLEKQARLWSDRLGIYQLIKRLFLALNRGKTINR